MCYPLKQFVQSFGRLLSIIGWYNNNFNNLHFIISLETTNITTCAADNSLMCCVVSER